MNIASVNLNLLIAFEALLEEKSVSTAAARIGLSQPALSNALRRLRVVFGDPLFVRTRNGMVPTPRALKLAGPVRGGLAQIRDAFAERSQFDPANARTFRLAMTDYAELCLIDVLAHRIQQTAPGVQIVVRRPERIFVPPEEALRDGTLDAAIGFFPEASSLEPGTSSQDLFTEENVCIARKGHPLMKHQLNLRQFANANHIAVFYRPDNRGFIDDILAGYGLRRRLRVASSHFLPIPFVVATTDLIAVVPMGLASRFRKTLKLEVRKVPLKMPPFVMRLLWHQRATDDPAHIWLRSQISACFAQRPLA
jgi:DNA-binding transcriptional LysR family regulator